MDFPLGAEVHCKDGRCGRSTYIILNPETEQVTHLVVQHNQAARVERLVPVSLITNTAAEVILLGCDQEEFLRLEPFNQTLFVRSELPHYHNDPSLTLLWPFTPSGGQTVASTIRSLPEGELAVHRGTKVLATDGLLGWVDEFLVNPETGQITDLVVRDDRPWKDRQVVIPITLIDQIRENQVFLNVDLAVIEEIPASHIRRK